MAPPVPSSVELPENQTAWKSNNQGVKETFIQTGRRGGARQWGREDTWKGGEPCRRGSGWQTRLSDICGISQEEQMESKTDHETQGSSPGN